MPNFGRAQWPTAPGRAPRSRPFVAATWPTSSAASAARPTAGEPCPRHPRALPRSCLIMACPVPRPRRPRHLAPSRGAELRGLATGRHRVKAVPPPVLPRPDPPARRLEEHLSASTPRPVPFTARDRQSRDARSTRAARAVSRHNGRPTGEGIQAALPSHLVTSNTSTTSQRSPSASHSPSLAAVARQRRNRARRAAIAASSSSSPSPALSSAPLSNSPPQ